MQPDPVTCPPRIVVLLSNLCFSYTRGSWLCRATLGVLYTESYRSFNQCYAARLENLSMRCALGHSTAPYSWLGEGYSMIMPTYLSELTDQFDDREKRFGSYEKGR